MECMTYLINQFYKIKLDLKSSWGISKLKTFYDRSWSKLVIKSLNYYLSLICGRSRIQLRNWWLD